MTYALPIPEIAPAQQGPLASAFVYLGGSYDYVDPHISTDGKPDPAKMAALVKFLRNGIGVTEIIVAWTAVGMPGGTYAPVGEDAQGDGSRRKQILDALFAACRARGVRVVLGLAFTMQAEANWPTDLTVRVRDADANKRLAQALQQLYPDTTAWYLPDEGCPPSLTETGAAYTAAQVQAVRSVSALPIYASPYLAGDLINVQTPASTIAAELATFQQQTGVDRVYLQDGGSVRPNGYTAAVRAAGVPCLGNVELFNASDASPAHPVRLANQFRLDGGACTCWLAQDNLMTPWAFYGYRAVAGIGGTLVPFSYQYVGNLPSARYADFSCTKLRDRATGTGYGPAAYTDSAWTGWLGPMLLEVNMPGNRWAVDFVPLHLLQQKSVGVHLPAWMQLSFRANGVWTPWTTHPMTIGDADGEYVLCNAEPLSQVADALLISLPDSGGWTFASELSLIAGG